MKKISVKSLCLLLVLLMFFGITEQRAEAKERKIFGLTVDDSYEDNVSEEEVLRAIGALKVKPTVRVVMSYDRKPKEYLRFFKRLKKYAFIMAAPVDSYDMKKYKTVKSYVKRYKDSFKVLSPFVDYWEIGNEINGEGWLGGSREFQARKMYHAYAFIHKKGGKTALTAYYTKPGLQEMEMTDWLKRYVPKRMKKGLDLLLVSYYEDDNENYDPDWKEVFTELGRTFKHPLLGIGECGFSGNATEEEKAEKLKNYYSLPKLTKNFVGGYFWWYWVQDMMPHRENELFRLFNRLGKKFQ